MANNQNQGRRPDDPEAPDPAARNPAERRQVEQVTGFQGDKQQMPLEGEQAIEEGGTSSAVPPTSSEPPGTGGRR
jgi:hypothetical protein